MRSEVISLKRHSIELELEFRQIEFRRLREPNPTNKIISINLKRTATIPFPGDTVPLLDDNKQGTNFAIIPEKVVDEMTCRLTSRASVTRPHNYFQR